MLVPGMLWMPFVVRADVLYLINYKNSQSASAGNVVDALCYYAGYLIAA